MPKFPGFSHRVSQIPASVYEKFRAKMKEQGENLIGLHIGDTYMPPQYSLPIDPAFIETHPDFNRYCSTFGVAPLRIALAEKAQTDNGLDVKKNNVLITNGATNALSISMMALVDPDDDVLVLTPCWPFFPGMVKIAGGNVNEAPFYMALYENPQMDIQDYLGQFVTSKTIAIYLNTPNNPSGKMLDRNQLQQIADFSRRHNLWVISDEAYDNLTFDNRPHISIASLPEMFDQTISVFTFSKIFMFAGIRLGFAIAGEFVLKNLNKMMVHQLYSPSTYGQYMMVEPVKTRHRWMKSVETHYQELRDLFVQNLKINMWEPEGTYFLFFSINDYLKNKDYWELIDSCLDSGISVALGSDFGKDYSDYIRLCFTGETPERLELAIERLNKIFILKT